MVVLAQAANYGQVGVKEERKKNKESNKTKTKSHLPQKQKTRNNKNLKPLFVNYLNLGHKQSLRS